MISRRRFLTSMVAGALTAKISVYEPEKNICEPRTGPSQLKAGTTYECGGEVDVFEFESIHWPQHIRRDHFERVKLHAAHWVYGPMPKAVIKISEPPTFAEARNWIVNRGGWIMPYYTRDDWEHMRNG